MFVTTISTALSKHGWARFHVLSLSGMQRHERDWSAFRKLLLRDLPPDPYDTTGLRKRRYGNFLWLPAADTVIATSRHFDDGGEPIAPYCQSSDFQSEFGGDIRWFAGFSLAILRSAVMHTLIAADGTLARRAQILPECDAYYVGVHAISLEPSVDCAAVITPDELHRDGEPVTFVHLLDRTNVDGGINTVATPDSVGQQPESVPSDQIFASFRLDNAGESFVVDDRKVSHHVSAVRLSDIAGFGRRAVLLVDFCPARRVLSDEI